MNNLCLVPFIGLPASGKTTTAIELVKYSSNISFIYISYDLFKRKLNVNDYKNGRFKAFREFMLQLINRILAALHMDNSEYSNTKKLLIENEIEWKPIINPLMICILIDDNHYYRSMRYEIYQLAKRYGTGFLQIYFKSTLEKALARNVKRFSTDQVPEEILIKMNIRLEPPNNKNNWEKNQCTISIDENNVNFEIIYEMISQQTINPEKANPTPEVTLNISQSKIHLIDIFLRKSISKCLKENNSNCPDELNKKRKRILADLRAKIIEIPNVIDEIQDYFVINK